MRKYKAPGTYANFIPTKEAPVSSFEQARTMAIVGTGQKSFYRKNVLLTRNNNALFDALPDNNIISIESISTAPITAREDQGNKLFNDYELMSDNLISWKRLKGPEFDAKATIEMAQGNKAFLDNITFEITDESLITTESYKIEISNVGAEGEGTYFISKGSTGEIMGEFVTSLEPIHIIPGISLTVLSTLLVVRVPEVKHLTKMGDYAVLKTTCPTSHIDPKYDMLSNLNIKESTLTVEHGGSQYASIGYGSDRKDVQALPSIENIITCNDDVSGLKFQLSMYKNSILTEVADCLDKLSVKISGTINGNLVSKVVDLYESPNVKLISDVSGLASAKSYDITQHIGQQLLKMDNIQLKYTYIVRNSMSLDNSNLVLQLDVIKEKLSSKSKKATEIISTKKLLTVNNGIFIRNTVMPHAVDDPNEIFKGLVKNIKITDKSKITAGYYLIKVKNIEKNEISLYNYKTGELIGTWSTSIINKYRDAIPGISFEVYSFRDIEGLIEMNGTKDITDLSGCGVLINTIEGIINPEVPQQEAKYYVSYRYSKPEDGYEPKVFNSYSDIVEEYGPYSVTESGVIINGISLAAEIALQNGANPLVVVQAKSETDSAYREAINKLGKKIEDIDSVNAIVALNSSKAVNKYVVDHVNKYSSSEYGMYRMAYLSAESNEPVDKVSTVSDAMQGSIQNASELYNERVVYVVPGMITKNVVDYNTGFASLKVLPGSYLAVAVAALAMKNDPAEPLTNKRIAGFTGLVNHYSEPELNLLSSNGCLAIKQENTILKVRHGVTTHSSTDTLADIQSNEITLVQIKDYVINGCRKTLGDMYVGGKLKPSIVSDMEFTLKSLLNKYVNDSIIINYEDLVVARDLSDPRQVNVKFLIEAVYPLNYIDITFGFSTTIS